MFKKQMSPKALLPGLKAWFAEYLRRFDSDDPTVQENVDLKAEHTRKVCEAIRKIGQSLELSEEDLCLAEASGLLHDIGRFEQYRRYRTFVDHRSENHALLGVKVIQSSRVLDGLDPAAMDIIIRAVAYHNRAALPEGEPERSLFFLKLLRDADKVDIWRVVTEYYRSKGNTRNRTIELDLPDTNRVSTPVYEALMNGRLVQTADLKTLQDFKLLQIGWIYDVNFPRTFQIVAEKKYLEAIRDALPKKSSRLTEIYERARTHLEQKASGGRRS
jgi:HD superfamily phosphodiesterase